MVIDNNASVAPLMKLAAKVHASDVYVVNERPPLYRVEKRLRTSDGSNCTREQILQYLTELLGEEKYKRFQTEQDVDAACALDSGERFRVNAFWEKGSPSFVARLIPRIIPTLEEVRAPKAIHNVLQEPHGLVLITGPTGSGKSTLLAAMIEELNRTRNLFITTIEDPIEFQFESKESTIVQRQLGDDVPGFPQGIKSMLRQNPDVILVGEMRDIETISATITLAETGHLVFASLHTNNASESIERIVDVFPAAQQSQIRLQFSLALRCIVSNVLVPRADGEGIIAAREVLVNKPSVSSLIRDANTVQIPNVLQTSAADHMHTLDQDLFRLVTEGLVSVHAAAEYAVNPVRLRELAEAQAHSDETR
jgi:twitching motility protein PilT